MVEVKSKDWRILEYFVPIEEKFEEGDNFIITGVAINETTTLNNVKYIAEELEKAAPTFRNVPILLDHRNEVKNIVGRTTERVNWNPLNKRIEFEAKIMDKDIKEMIRDGRIGSVSIGAKVNDLLEESDGSMKAVGIRGLEISLVAVPGDSNATLAQALQNNFVLKEQAMLNKQEDKREVIEMAEEEQKTASEVETKEEETKEEVEKEEAKEEVAEEKVSKKIDEIKKNDTSTIDMTEMKSEIKAIKEMLLEKKKTMEEVKMVDETKGEVAVNSVEEKADSSVIVEKARNGFALYKDYEKETSGNLKRLVR